MPHVATARPILAASNLRARRSGSTSQRSTRRWSASSDSVGHALLALRSQSSSAAVSRSACKSRSRTASSGSTRASSGVTTPSGGVAAAILLCIGTRTRRFICAGENDPGGGRRLGCPAARHRPGRPGLLETVEQRVSDGMPRVGRSKREQLTGVPLLSDSWARRASNHSFRRLVILMTGNLSDSPEAAAMRSSLEPVLICGRGNRSGGAMPIAGVAPCGLGVCLQRRLKEVQRELGLQHPLGA